MQNAMYTAIFGALTNEMRLNSITNNLANVNTTGYKRDILGFKDTMERFAHDQIMEPMQNLRAEPLFPEPIHMAKPRISLAVTDFQQGGMKVTGNPLDMAISGQGFFKVRSPQGDFYTRNGHFRMTPEGTVITDQGFPVLSEGGDNINIPAGYKSLTLAEDGRIFADEDLVGQVGLVEVDSPQNLEKFGQNLFRPREGSQVQDVPPENSFLAQGFLEAANVDPVYEMVNMIEAQRQFEAYTKVMQASETLDKAATQQIGKGR